LRNKRKKSSKSDHEIKSPGKKPRERAQCDGLRLLEITHGSGLFSYSRAHEK